MMAGTSLPISKHYFTETVVDNNQWVNISPVRKALEEKYRHRSGAITKHSSSAPSPTQIVKGFTIDDPSVGMAVRHEEEEAMVGKRDSTDQCVCCLSLQNQLTVCNELNGLLLKKFSRIIHLIDEGKKTIEKMEEEVGLRRCLGEGETNPMFVASQNLCYINEQDKALRRESGLDYMSIDMGKSIVPSTKESHPSTQLSQLSHSLQQTLAECRDISLSSASLCFENQFNRLSLSSEGSTPTKKNQRPPLQRMHTLSNATDISNLTSSVEYSLEVGSLGSSMAHWHSEQKPSERASTLRRTHSENEMLSPSIESRVLLLDSGTVEEKDSNDLTSSNNPVPGYTRVFSTPDDGNNHKTHPPLSRDYASHDIPFRSHLMSALKYKSSIDSTDSTTGDQPTVIEENTKSLAQGLTSEESTHLLEKISTLEKHRLSLLEDIEKMKDKNNRLWETIEDLREELGEKEFQLKLLSADVQLAIKEINGANQQKLEANFLRQQNHELMTRLENLEDESKAVKESLVQLVTEKAATNKALAIENQRLRVKMKRSPSTTTKDADFTDGDTFTDEDEFRMQGLIAELDSGEYVHKQGFLTKQGNKRRNWKKRMFVLDTHALSYYKTEEPLGSVPLQEITKVQVSHLPPIKHLTHLFEIHRNEPSQKVERIYYLSAPTYDEMQSWIGIIQTLKDTKRQSLRQSVFMDLDTTSPVGSPTDSSIIMKPRSLTTSAQQGSLTLPPNAERNARQRKTVMESGVRNRMFTDTGQRRTDITIPINSSDEEDTVNPSVLSVSSDEDHHLSVRNSGNHRSSSSDSRQ